MFVPTTHGGTRRDFDSLAIIAEQHQRPADQALGSSDAVHVPELPEERDRCVGAVRFDARKRWRSPSAARSVKAGLLPFVARPRGFDLDGYLGCYGTCKSTDTLPP